uniref:CULT domain-containing protein n=1 Tax=Bursaphelenchus xylophilus TaxID=6326 RepID=A0A1I7RHT4_BURXY
MEEDLDSTDEEFEMHSFGESDSSSSDLEVEREPFDQNAPAQHLYLSSGGNTTSMALPDLVEPDSEISVLVFLLPTPVVPFETVPINANETRFEEIEDHLKNGLVGCSYIDCRHEVHPPQILEIGTLASVEQVIRRATGFGLVCKTRQRFILVNKVRMHQIHYSGDYNTIWVTNVKVRALRDAQPGPLCRDYSAVLSRISNTTRQQYLRELTSLSQVALQYSDVNNYTKNLTQWLLRWFDEAKLKKELGKGLLSFSFWVATALPTDAMAKIGFLRENSAVNRLVLEWKAAKQLSLLCCRTCGKVIADMKDLFNIMADGMSSNFVNPHGYIHNMFTCTNLRSVAYTGPAQDKDSWFPGYSWRIANCEACGLHLGWRFHSNKKQPKSFFGLVRSSITVREEEEAREDP